MLDERFGAGYAAAHPALLAECKWAESTARAEARGVAQGAKTVVDGLRGKGWRVGMMAQALGGTVLAALVANQALNLFTRGKPTWENPEDGHQWDAWIPGGPGNRGYFFSPLSIAAEYSHAMLKYMEGGEGAIDAAAHIAGNKLSGGARAVKDLVTGKDWKGEPFGSTRERLTAAATDMLPSPMPLSGTLQKDPKAPLGYKMNHEPGSLQKQLFASAGMKLDPAKSARAQMFQVAEKFRHQDGAAATTHAASAYTELRHRLDNNDLQGAAEEFNRLRDEGKKAVQIRQAFGIKADGTLHKEAFTGSTKGDEQMFSALEPEQRKLYWAAQKEHAQLAQRLRQVAERARREEMEPAGANS